MIATAMAFPRPEVDPMPATGPFRRFEPFLALAYLAGLAALSVQLQGPPAVEPATAPADRFSAERAMTHVDAIAARPHPMGSPEAASVRNYLRAELQSLGLEVRTQTDDKIPGENLIAVRPGSRPGGKAVMLAAHSDSVTEGPGAGDDAAGVAAILEAVRALGSGPPIANDLIVLLTDGEERGLLGAQVFAKDQAWVDRVGLVLNFEGRGNRGPSYMFETSEGNGRLIREFARAAPHPMATSLAYAVYQRMPNSTDLTIFKEHGLPGLNFAFVDGVEHYHRPTDTPANLDRRSLQHHGSYALALARHFGNLDLGGFAPEPDAIYFHAFGPHLVVYPASWAWPLAIAAVVAFAAVVGWGLHRGRLSARGLAAGLAISLFAIAAATVVPYGLWRIIQPWRTPVPGKHYTGSPQVAWGLAAVGLLAALATLWPGRGRASVADRALGGLAWWLVLLIAVTAALPGGSYLFLGPFALGLIGVAATVARPGLAGPGAYLGAIAALGLVPPTVQSLCVALGPSLPFAAAPLAGLLVVGIWPVVARILPAGTPTARDPAMPMGKMG
ncbi:M28 family peptidase [Tundrisphaera sp. TA3]|uniref:M28 family peptidase n=1 Tax=Tundrisphaera sp. TA3 TaxID=3435775 RepID=UPI003EBD4EF3